MGLEKALDRLKKGGKINCSKCNTAIESSAWVSEWCPTHPDVFHYKSFHCDCGKKNWIKVDFHGSGHDEVFEQRDKELKSAIRKVNEWD